MKKIVCRDPDDMVALHAEGALEAGNTLGHSYITTPSVINAYGDTLHPVHQLLTEKWISLFHFSEAHIVNVAQIYHQNSRTLSYTDCTVIFCAIATNGVLISNERIIIKACVTFNIRTYTTDQYSKQVKLSKTG